MLTRRDFLQVAAATAVLTGASGSLSRLAAQQRLTQADLLRFQPLGQVTLLHFTDLHAQLVPLYFREPTWNIGVGSMRGLVPHLTGADLLRQYNIAPGTPEAYALTDQDFTALARSYGRVGGLDRMATLIKAIRAERPNNTLLLDGGDSWQGSYTALQTRGEDMVSVLNTLGIDAMTAHWEFTYGQDRVKELVKKTRHPFLAGNVRDATWNEDIFSGETFFERGGVKIAVIGQAFPYTPIANPRYMMPDWSFGINEERLVERIANVRAQGAELVVLLSHNGFDVDRKLAARISGIDVILTGHTHDAIPDVVKVGDTLLIASGSHGKFLARLDLDIKNKRIAAWRFKLIPVLSDVITPDPETATLVRQVRAPHQAELDRVLGQTETLLYRRGNLAGTFDDLICQSLLVERDAQIALSPGFRWGATLLPGQDIRVEDVFSQTAITYPNVYRTEFTGAYLKEVLEDVADNLFNPDPYYQQGGDMVRVGGMSFSLNVSAGIGSRISDMRLHKTGETIDPEKNYVIAGWASVNEDTQGPPVWDLVMRHIASRKTVRIDENRSVKVINS
ncbi:MAG: thiosulfohydrolase SoxB [Rhodospirillales bacterium]|nr:thiosulfohydrolase SoxB [Rhodospirillales bacterium]